MLYVNRIFELYKEHSWQCVSVFVVAYLAVLLGGALIFKSIEEPAEIASRKVLEIERFKILKKLSDCNVSLTERDLDEYARVVLRYGFQKVTLFGNMPSPPNWGIGQSIFFSGSVITTLGYAQTTYLTTGGKLFAMFFIIIGVPLTLFFFTACVHKIHILYAWQRSYIAKLMPSLTLTHVKLVHFFLVCIALWALLLIAPALVFCEVERWNYTDAFFFCFMSMTTVGMVEQLPGDQRYQSNRTVYKLSLLFYMYIGLICVLSALELFSDIPTSGEDSSTDIEFDQYRPKRLKDDEQSAIDLEAEKFKNYQSVGSMEAVEEILRSDDSTDSVKNAIE